MRENIGCGLKIGTQNCNKLGIVFNFSFLPCAKIVFVDMYMVANEYNAMHWMNFKTNQSFDLFPIFFKIVSTMHSYLVDYWTLFCATKSLILLRFSNYIMNKHERLNWNAFVELFRLLFKNSLANSFQLNIFMPRINLLSLLWHHIYSKFSIIKLWWIFYEKIYSSDPDFSSISMWEKNNWNTPFLYGWNEMNINYLSIPIWQYFSLSLLYRQIRYIALFTLSMFMSFAARYFYLNPLDFKIYLKKKRISISVIKNSLKYTQYTYRFHCTNLNRIVGILIRLLLILIENLSSLFFLYRLLNCMRSW